MAYPNFTPYNIVIAQTSGSNVNGQYPFTERIISGSNLFIVTDANGLLTASSFSPTSSVAISASYALTSSFSQTSSVSLLSNVDKINDNSTYYVTFVNNTGSNVALKTDADVLSYNPSLNRVTLGNTSGSLIISNDNGVNPNYIYLSSEQNVAGGHAQLQVGNPTSNTTSSFVVGQNQFIVATGQTTTGVFTSLVTTITNATNNNGLIYNNGALIVDGGVGIGKNLFVSGSMLVGGDFTVFGSSSVVYISSSTVIINDNIIQLNAFFPFERYAGFEVFDSGSNQRSASLLWDGQSDNWTTVDQNNSASNIIIGPTASFGSAIPNLTVNRLPKAYEGNGITDSLISDDGTTLRYTGTTISSSIITSTTGSFTALTVVTGSAPLTGSQVPSSPTAVGMPGQIEVDNNFIYVYTNNIWKRVPLSTWSL